MQTSGSFPQLSDGVRKKVSAPVKTIAPRVAMPAPMPAPKMAAPVAPKPSAHRRGGFSKHAKGGK